MTNVDLIEEFVFSAAFSTFDQVTFVEMLCVLFFFFWGELEGGGRLNTKNLFSYPILLKILCDWF